MIAEEAYVLSKSFTNNSIKGITGTLAGKNCTIKSATKADDVTTVVFAWTADDGTEKTTTIQVNDGAKGDIGISIDNVTINANSHLIVTLSDGSTIDAGLIQGGSGTDDYEDLINRPKIEGVDLIGNKTFEDLGVASATDLAQTDGHLQDKVDKTSIATELSDASTDDEVVGALTAYNELQKLESANKEQFATATGDYITVNDSVDGNIVELGIKGNSFQQTYSGKNLLSKTNISYNATGLTITDNKNGTYSITSGTTTGTEFRLIGAYNNLTKEIHLDTSKTYKVTAKIGSANLSTICVFTDGSTYTNVNSTQTSFTPPDGFEDISSIFIRFDSSASYSGTLEVMLYEYTEGIDETFEPYVGGTPSPNPNYPQTIKSVGDDGSLVVKSENKNILNIPDGSKDSNGITTTALNGRITCSGTSTAKFADVIHNISILFQSNNVYTFSIGKPIDCDISIKLHDSNGTALSDKRILKGSTSITFTAPENVARATFYIAGFESGTAISISNLCLQVEKGDVATLPVLHEESTTTIPLSEPLRSIGDIKDEITYQNGKWGILRRIKEINLTGLAWVLVNNDTYQYWHYSVNDGKEASSYNTIANIIAEKYMASSWYNTVRLNSATNAIAYGFNANNTSAKIVAVHNGSTTESPTGKFLYELATPIFEPFADQSLPYLSTYDGATNISNDDALSAEMTVKYPTTDASGVASRNESRIVELAKDTNESLVRVDKNTIANLCNGKNGNNIIIGQIKANTIYTLFFEQDSETGFNLKLNISDGVNVSYKEISPTYSKTKVICWFSNTYDGNIFFNGWKGVNQRNFMIAEGKFDEWIDYITPTGNSGRLNVDVANLKNDVGSTDISDIGDGTITNAISMMSSKLGGLTFSASGTTLSITDGTNTWTLEANS